MICKNCGALIDDDVKFCTSCGEKVEAPAPEIQDADTPLYEKIDFDTDTDSTSKAKSNIRKPSSFVLRVLLVVVVAVAIIGGMIVHSVNSKVNFDGYIKDTINATGISGYGTIDYNSAVDYEKLSQDLGDSKVESQYDYETETEIGPAGVMATHVYVDVNKFENLSNGDVVKVKITVNYKKINKMGFKKKLVGKKTYETELTVQGLEDALVINPFDAVTNVVYDYTEDWNQERIVYNPDYKQTLGDRYVALVDDGNGIGVKDPAGNILFNITFYVDQVKEGSTSDKVYVNVEQELDQFLEEYGVVIGEASKEVDKVEINYCTDAQSFSGEIDNWITDVKARASLDAGTNAQCTYVGTYFCTNEYGENAVYFLFHKVSEYDNYYKAYKLSNIKCDNNGKLYYEEEFEDLWSRWEKVAFFETDIKGNWNIAVKLKITH